MNTGRSTCVTGMFPYMDITSLFLLLSSSNNEIIKGWKKTRQQREKPV